MRTRLATKIFFAFFLTAAVIAALLIGMQYYSIRNFAEYVNRVEFDRFKDLEARLIAIHAEHGGWGPLRNNQEAWFDLLEKAGIDTATLRRPTQERMSPPEPPGRRPVEEHPPRGPGRFRHPPPPPPYGAAQPFHIAFRLVLLDAEKTRVVGLSWHPREEFTLEPIRSGNRTIGWLGLHRVKHLSDPFAEAFLKRQTTFLYLTGAAALFLTTLVTLMLSRQILGPVKALTEGTQAVTSRQFGRRISVRSTDELGQLAEAFNSMSHTLERYETTRQQWISDISHELRTPLAVLRGEIEALQDGVRKADAGSLSSLHAEVIRIGRLVDDLHLLSLADSQSLVLKNATLDPIGVLRETVALFRNRLDERGLTVDLVVEAGRPSRMKGDPDRMKQVFSNLLNNALQHMDLPGTLRIRARSEGRRLTIGFEDSGPGVPPESLDQLFDRLYRVERSRNRASGGSGLGLAICKQIVEAHAGSIEAGNSQLGGLSIRITLNA